jgi:hypothetical protein
MGHVPKFVWTCDGTCGTTVETDTETLPEGWMQVTFGFTILSATSGLVIDESTRTFHTLGPCLYDWGVSQMSNLVAQGADIGTGAPTPPA